MKALALAPALLAAILTISSCHKADDVAPIAPQPTLTQAELLVGRWTIVQQTSTDGQTTNTGTWTNGYYVREFTSSGNYLNYSGTQLNSTYPYSLTNGVITVNGTRPILYTITSLTKTALVVTYSGAPSYPTLTFTDSYVRASK